MPGSYRRCPAVSGMPGSLPKRKTHSRVSTYQIIRTCGQTAVSFFAELYLQRYAALGSLNARTFANRGAAVAESGQHNGSGWEDEYDCFSPASLSESEF